MAALVLQRVTNVVVAPMASRLADCAEAKTSELDRR
jgi:hypothetical protein